jgi:hypothetical protein
MSNKMIKLMPSSLIKRVSLGIPRILFAILLLVALTGSTISVSCMLYNNTDNVIQIIREYSDGNIDELDIKPKKSKRLDSWIWGSLEIRAKGVSWKYKPVNPDNDFIEFTGWGPWAKRIFRAQVEADGRIFILPSGQKQSVSKHIEQPSGFPITPMNE